MRKGSPSINTRGSYEIWKVWKANRKNIGGQVMQLSRYVVLENNEHSSNFPSCDIGLFHSQLSLYVFVLLFFKKKKKESRLYLLSISIFFIFAMSLYLFWSDKLNVTWLDESKPFSVSWVLQGHSSILCGISILSSSSIFFALDNRIKMNTL